MAMSKQDFIALADVIKQSAMFHPSAIEELADFCEKQNSAFDRNRWLDYIAGKCGPNGGKHV